MGYGGLLALKNSFCVHINQNQDCLKTLKISFLIISFKEIDSDYSKFCKWKMSHHYIGQIKTTNSEESF